MPEQLPSDEVLPRPPMPPTWRERLDALLARNRAPSLVTMVASALVLVVFGGGGYLLLRSPAAPPELTLPLAGTSAEPSGPTTTAPPEQVVVDAAGAVVHPGLYRLPAGSRVADLVDAAGGLTAEADLDRLNLAAPLEDGHRIYVPRVGEPEPPVVDDSGPGSGGDATGTGPTPDDPVDLNTATLADLDELPGIGPATAEAIIHYRDDHGPFSTVDQLLEVPGIGDVKLAAIRDLVGVG